MKRDMELFRKILIKIEEEAEPGVETISSLDIQDYDIMVIAEHCNLLNQAGLIKRCRFATGRENRVIVLLGIGNLTNAGHDYLELIRNDGVWKDTKTEIEKRNLPRTIDNIARVAGIFAGNVVDQIIPK